jgi:hypothetical protein
MWFDRSVTQQELLRIGYYLQTFPPISLKPSLEFVALFLRKFPPPLL